MLPIIIGEENIPNIRNRLFMNLEAFTDDITDTKPDLYDGSDPTQIDTLPREDLCLFIVPLTQQSTYSAKFLCRREGSGDASSVAERQAYYDGTLGACTMRQIQSFSHGLRATKHIP